MPRTISARLGNVRPSKGLGCVPQMEPTMINLESFEYRRCDGAGFADGSADREFRPGTAVRASRGVRRHARGWRRCPAHGRWRRSAHGRWRCSSGVGGGPRMGWRRRPYRWRRCARPRYSGGGGGYGGYRRHGGGGFIPGAVAGAVIGGAIASQSYGYYGGPGYYAPGYYDDQYYDEGLPSRSRRRRRRRAATACSATVPTIRRRAPISAMTAIGTPARNRT